MHAALALPDDSMLAAHTPLPFSLRTACTRKMQPGAGASPGIPAPISVAQIVNQLPVQLCVAARLGVERAGARFVSHVQRGSVHQRVEPLHLHLRILSKF